NEALKYLEKHHDVGAVGGGIVSLDERFREKNDANWKDGPIIGYCSEDKFPTSAFTHIRNVGHCFAPFFMTPRSLFLENGGLKSECSLTGHEYIAYCLRLRENGKRVVNYSGLKDVWLDTKSFNPRRIPKEDLLVRPRSTKRTRVKRMLHGLKSRIARGVLVFAGKFRVLVRLLPFRFRNKIGCMIRGMAIMEQNPSNRKKANLHLKNIEASINTFGFFERPFGLGQAVRGIADCFESLHIPSQRVSFDERQLVGIKPLPKTVRPNPEFAINFCSVNAASSQLLHQLFGEKVFAGKYNIAYWVWELEDLPPIWDNSFNYYDEIWVPTKFVQQAVAARADVPVVCIPYCVQVNHLSQKSEVTFGIPQDRPIILCMFDAGSLVERKNPFATIQAIKKACSSLHNPFLVVKTARPEMHNGLLDRLYQEIQHMDCKIIDHWISREETLELINACDMLVSLHRSEGFGLILAEAMALGKAVIATGYSGNMEYMNQNNSFLVNYDLITIEHDIGPYPAGSRWAEPNTEHAGKLIAQLLENPEYGRQIGRRAAKDLAQSYSIAAVRAKIRQRFERLGFTVAYEPTKQTHKHTGLSAEQKDTSERLTNLPLSSAIDFKSACDFFCKSALEVFLNFRAELAFSSSERPKVSVIIILYNRAELTLACLKSLLAFAHPSWEVILVDNASTDRTPELLSRIRGVRVIGNRENKGFSAAVNQAAAIAKGDYLLLLNNDAQILGNGINEALKYLEKHHDVGAVGGRIISINGRLQEAGSIVLQDGITTGYGLGDDPYDSKYRSHRDVDYCSGAFLMTPRKLFLDLGGLDKKFYPAYYEDVDYCIKLWKNGKRVVYHPEVSLLHYHCASSDLTKAVELSQEKREIFVQLHQDWLKKRYPFSSSGNMPAPRAQEQGKRVA
ncbi:MAG: glycosyltransferase, partial [Thermoguttaceae bacterium]